MRAHALKSKSVSSPAVYGPDVHEPKPFVRALTKQFPAPTTAQHHERGLLPALTFTYEAVT